MLCYTSADGGAAWFLLRSAANSTVYDLSWSDISALASSAPAIAAFELERPKPLAPCAEQSKFGGIAAVARVSPGVCVVTTDTPLVFQDALAPAMTGIGGPSGTVLFQERRTNESLLHIRDTSSSTSSSLLLDEAESPSESVASTHSIVDLTALRVTASSDAMSSLRILDQPEVRSVYME